MSIVQKPASTIAFIALCLFVANVSWGQKTDVQDRDIERILREKTQLRFEQQIFSSVLNDIRDKHKINIIVRDSAKKVGLNQDDLVNLEVKDTTLHTALTMLLDQYECGYVIRNGFLQIMTKKESYQISRIKNYDCRELIKHLSESQSSASQPANKQTSAQSDKKISIKSAAKNDSSESKAGKKLVDAIVQMTGQKEWSQFGGKGAIVELNGWLLVRQHEVKHREVEKVIQLLKSELGVRD